MKGRAVTVLLVLVLLSCASNMSLAMDEMTIDQVILVLWHGLTWDDVDAMQWDVPAAWGLLNTRGGGGETLSAAHLSIGAGARAVGLRGIEAFLQEGEGESLF